MNYKFRHLKVHTDKPSFDEEAIRQYVIPNFQRPAVSLHQPRAWVYNLACAGRINIRMRGVRAYSSGDSARYRVHSQAFFRQATLCAADELHYGRMRIRVLHVCAVLY